MILFESRGGGTFTPRKVPRCEQHSRYTCTKKILQGFFFFYETPEPGGLMWALIEYGPHLLVHCHRPPGVLLGRYLFSWCVKKQQVVQVGANHCFFFFCFQETLFLSQSGDHPQECFSQIWLQPIYEVQKKFTSTFSKQLLFVVTYW